MTPEIGGFSPRRIKILVVSYFLVSVAHGNLKSKERLSFFLLYSAVEVTIRDEPCFEFLVVLTQSLLFKAFAVV